MTKHLTPLKAIRAKCLDCSAGIMAEVRLCPVANCALYPYRMGKRPNTQPRQEQLAKPLASPIKKSKEAHPIAEMQPEIKPEVQEHIA